MESATNCVRDIRDIHKIQDGPKLTDEYGEITVIGLQKL